jgi:hypothetical protein
MRRRTKFAIGCLGALLVIGLGVTIAVHVSGALRDAPPPDDTDLQVQRLDIPPEENAFTYLELIDGLLYWPEDEEREAVLVAALEGDAWDEEAVAELLERNAEALAELDRALACGQMQVPAAVSYETQLPYLPRWRDLARITCLRARSLLIEGRDREAFGQLMDGVRFGHMIQRARGGVIHCFVGASIKGTTLQTMGQVLGDAELPAVALCDYTDRLAGYGADEEGYARAFRSEYAAMTEMVDIVVADPKGVEQIGSFSPVSSLLLRGHLFKPNQTKRVFAATCRAIAENTSRTFANRDSSAIPQVPEALLSEHWLKTLGTPNAIGWVLFAMVTPAYERVHEQKCMDNVRVGATRVMLALRAYQIERGELPQTLEALVPDYLDAVPLDDFDGEPLRYSRERRVVYSVGTDLRDAGGLDPSDPAEPEEPTFPIEF